MNKAIIIGNLTRKPEKRGTPSGVSVCTFTVAINRRSANQQGQREADYIPVVVWRGLADNCAQFLHKGSKVGVCGEIRTRTYDAQDGSKRYVTEVVADEVQFLDSKPSQGGNAPEPKEYTGDAMPDFEAMEDDDDLPWED